MGFVTAASEDLSSMTSAAAVKFITQNHDDHTVYLAALNHPSKKVQETTVDFLCDRHKDTSRGSTKYDRVRDKIVRVDDSEHYKEYVVFLDFATNPNSPSRFLMNLANVHPAFANAIAKSSTCAPEVLHYLSTGFKTTVVKNVAKNPNTPVKTLRQLAQVRGFEPCVAENPSTPVDILTRIAETTTKPSTCIALGGNPSVTESMLLSVVLRPGNKGYTERSSRRIWTHPAWKPETLTRFYWTDYSQETAYTAPEDYLVVNPNTPLDVLEHFVESHYELNKGQTQIQGFFSFYHVVLSHPNSSAELLLRAYRYAVSLPWMKTYNIPRLAVAYVKRLKKFPEYENYPAEWVEALL